MYRKFTVLKDTQNKYPDRVIHKPVLVEGPTLTVTGMLSMFTGSLPGINIVDFFTQKSERQSVFNILDSKKRNVYIGDPVVGQYVVGNEENLEYVADSDLTVTANYQNKGFRSLKKFMEKDFQTAFLYIHEFDQMTHVNKMTNKITLDTLARTSD